METWSARLGEARRNRASNAPEKLERARTLRRVMRSQAGTLVGVGMNQNPGTKSTSKAVLSVPRPLDAPTILCSQLPTGRGDVPPTAGPSGRRETGCLELGKELPHP
jgi:hypothetical protein